MASSTAPYTKDVDDIKTSPAPLSDTSSQLDDTYEAYKNNQAVGIDPAEAKQTLKKIDTRIVPILFFAYLLQYLDKNGINYASAFGLQEGTNLKGQDYSWLGKCHSILRNGTLMEHRQHLLLWLPRRPVPSRISTATPPHG
jgi:hypothetical protein